MRAAVTVVMMDIVKSRTIQRRLRELVGTKADREYTTKIYSPCHQRVADVLAKHNGNLHDDVGDQFAAYFDHAQDAVEFSVVLQRLMSSAPIVVPDGCDCPHVQLHLAIGIGSMESDAYQNPGTARVLTFGDVARILAITDNDQVLITPDAFNSAGRITGVTPHAWDVVLPKEGDHLTVIELLWDGRQPRRPKDKAGAPSETPPRPTSKALRVVLVYRRSTEPDGRVLSILETALKEAGHSVFIDRHLKIGVEWARQIEQEIRSADAVIALLSAASVHSEMMAYELRTAGEASEKAGKPRILPVRLAFEDKLPAELAGVLDRLQYFLWKGPSDDGRLVQDLLPALVDPPKPAPIDRARLEPAEGAVPLDARFYVVRPVDDEAATAVARHDSIILIKGARQMGKTSLMARAARVARDGGMRVLRTDFQKLTAAQFNTLDGFYQAIAQVLADQLNLDVAVEQEWKPNRGANGNFESFVRRRVLADPGACVLWAMDEVDRLFTCSFSGDVFGLLRTWHNDRAMEPDGPWDRLTMAIAYATEAHLFISDPNQSPFNVGTRLVLEDFTPDQVADLDRRHGSPLGDAGRVAAFHQLTGGQPYLVRRGLNEIVSRGLSAAEFAARADRDDGPYGDHLRRILVLLARDDTMLRIVRELLAGKACADTDRFFRLRSGGLVAGDSREDCRFRCGVYMTYLARHLL